MDFFDILVNNNIPIAPDRHEHSRQGWVQFDCPYCEPGALKFHMGYNLAYKYCNCWRCGGHSTAGVLVELLGVSWREAKDMVSELPSDELEHVEYHGKLNVPYAVGKMTKRHKAYLRSRGYKPKNIAKLWGVGGIGIDTRLAWRLFIPVQYHGQTLTWTTRSILPNPKLRYIDASKGDYLVNKCELLYGQDYARHSIVVVEGPCDVWKIGPGAVGLLGMGTSNTQIQKMLQYGLRVICFDNTPDAQRRAEQLCDLLSLYPGTTYNVQLDSKDAGCATKKEIKRIRKVAQL